jgi:hypothetical protein
LAGLQIGVARGGSEGTLFWSHACAARHGFHHALLVLKTRLRRPPWGRIFLVFRSKNGPQAERL